MPPKLPTLDGVEHRYAQVGDLRMHYAETGDPAADALLLVHGWPQNWWAWRRLIPPLAERFHVVAPDLRGLGWTEPAPHGYEKANLARDVIGLMDELGIERARWVGHDWGGFAGWHATTEHPERFERFVCLSVPHPWPPDRPEPTRLLRAWYQAVLAAPLVGRLAVGAGFPGQALKRSRKAGEWSDEELDFYGDLLRRPGYTSATQQYYRSFLLREIVPLARGQFADRRLTVPTRLVVGSSDAIVRGMGESYRDHADDMEVIWIDGAAHWLPDEKPDAVLEIALGFLP